MDLVIQENEDATDPDSPFYGPKKGEAALHNIFLDLFIAGMETTSSSLAFTFLYMLHHPDTQHRVHMELDKVSVACKGEVVFLTCYREWVIQVPLRSSIFTDPLPVSLITADACGSNSTPGLFTSGITKLVEPSTRFQLCAMLEPVRTGLSRHVFHFTLPRRARPFRTQPEFSPCVGLVDDQQRSALYGY
jgi:hypothetical protein